MFLNKVYKPNHTVGLSDAFILLSIRYPQNAKAMTSALANVAVIRFDSIVVDA